MLIQDSLTGRLHEVPDQLYRSYLGECGRVYGQQYPQGYGHSPHYVQGQVVYDGLGNPVGIAPLLAMLAPLAAKVLPVIADKVLPMVSKILPAISNILPGAEQSPQPQPQPPTAMSPAPAPPTMETPAPMPIQTPAQPVMATPAMAPFRPMPVPYPPMPVPYPMMAPRVVRGRRHRGHRPVRRRIAVPPQPPPPPPPEVMQPVREPVSAEPSGAVQGWGYYGGFNGYRWR